MAANFNYASLQSVFPFLKYTPENIIRGTVYLRERVGIVSCGIMGTHLCDLCEYGCYSTNINRSCVIVTDVISVYSCSSRRLCMSWPPMRPAIRSVCAGFLNVHPILFKVRRLPGPGKNSMDVSRFPVGFLRQMLFNSNLRMQAPKLTACHSPEVSDPRVIPMPGLGYQQAAAVCRTYSLLHYAVSGQLGPVGRQFPVS